MAVRLNDVDVACQACSSFVATDLWAISETLLTEGPATRPGVTDPGYSYAAFFAGCFCFARDFAVDLVFASVCFKLFCKTETRSITLVGLGVFFGFVSISFPPA
jgi:hypothetical protein